MDGRQLVQFVRSPQGLQGRGHEMEQDLRKTAYGNQERVEKGLSRKESHSDGGRRRARFNSSGRASAL